MNTKVKARLIVDVEFESGGVPPVVLLDMLDYIPRMAASNGMMTGDTEAVVNSWEARALEVLPAPADLEDWVLDAVENGNITLDETRLVRYALMEPAEVLAEWRERAGEMAMFDIEQALCGADLDVLEAKIRASLSHLQPKHLDEEIAEREAGMAQLLWRYRRCDLLLEVLSPEEVKNLRESSPWVFTAPADTPAET